MGLSTTVIGFTPADAKWKQMKAIWDACVAAKVDIPQEVREYFNWTDPEEAGVQVEISKTKWESSALNAEGFDIYLDEIPKHVKIIRFYNSW